MIPAKKYGQKLTEGEFGASRLEDFEAAV